jgi:hypothetical protein
MAKVVLVRFENDMATELSPSQEVRSWEFESEVNLSQLEMKCPECGHIASLADRCFEVCEHEFPGFHKSFAVDGVPQAVRDGFNRRIRWINVVGER